MLNIGGVEDNANLQAVASEIDEPRYMRILKDLPPFLSLDISVQGSGVAIWHDGELTMFRVALDAKEKTARRFEFRQNLIDLCRGKEFKYVVIENTIGGKNFETNTNLYQLNCIPDDLCYTQDIHIENMKNILRVQNTTWKRHLKMLAPLDINTKIVNDKDATKLRLNYLGFGLDDTLNSKQSEDIFDALGMGISEVYNAENEDFDDVKPTHKKLVKSYGVQKYKARKYSTEVEHDKKLKAVINLVMSKTGVEPTIFKIDASMIKKSFSYSFAEIAYMQENKVDTPIIYDVTILRSTLGDLIFSDKYCDTSAEYCSFLLYRF